MATQFFGIRSVYLESAVSCVFMDFDELKVTLDHTDDIDRELRMLEELGFGLDLTQCAATGGNDDLIYVSPKSGRRVEMEVTKPPST